MNEMTVTALYAAIFGLLFVLLSFRALCLRHRFGVDIGDGERPLPCNNSSDSVIQS